MTALVDRINVDLTEARRRRDEIALRTLAMLKSELVNASKEPGAAEIDDQAALGVIRREVKRRQEAAEAFAAGGREESAREEQVAAELLQGYLPVELGEQDLEREVQIVIAEVGAQGPRDMGAVMKAATARVAGRAEPGRVAAAARKLLAG
jgi:uncharacterized protein YqeY